MKLNQLVYLAGYGFRALALRQRKPVVAGMPLTDVCNLECVHCVVANTGRGPYSFSRIESILRHFYDIGVRIMYLQGGEIMTWQDGDKRINDVIRLAREIGFFKVAVVTNGTMGIDIDADLVWVSMDGSRPVHDSIRGQGVFDRVMQSLSETRHRQVIFNMTLNRLNCGEVENLARMARDIPTVRGVTFNFHTPYQGVEDICLPQDERVEVIDRILDLKKRGYPVLNSRGGLLAMRENRWKRPVPMIHLMEKDSIYECCFGREQPGVCEQCGYGVIAEMSQIMNWNIPTMLNSLSLFG